MEAIVSTNNVNEYTVSELNYLRSAIENMTKMNQLGILKILCSYKSVTLNENKYGVHVNLSGVEQEPLAEMFKYVKYVNSQESNLNADEQQKEEYKNTYFSAPEQIIEKQFKDIVSETM